MTIEEYYKLLQKNENLELKELIHFWNHDDIKIIEHDFQQAISKIKSIQIPMGNSKTNQSLGLLVEYKIPEILNPYLNNFEIVNCKGAGYPDMILRSLKKDYPLEIKTTSIWNPKDSNRRVLTSSSKKLRKVFSGEINHLILTNIYTMVNGFINIKNIRLDFLNPDVKINIRYEMSVSHKILHNSDHKNVTFLID